MIEDRYYLKQEQADALYLGSAKPASRVKCLWREVTGCPRLLSALRSLRYRPASRGFTRRQVMAIKEWLCLD